MRMLAVGSKCGPHVRSLRVTLCPPRGLALLGAARRCVRCPHVDPRLMFGLFKHHIANRFTRGFTLLELLVVIAIMALATAGVSLAMRDNAQTSLEREAQRLAVLFESARAQSRTSGVRVVWHTTANGFQFDGLTPGALPDRWLTEGTTVGGTSSIQLGPEPIIGPQAVVLLISQPAGQSTDQASRSLQVATDGLRPFAVQAVGQP